MYQRAHETWDTTLKQYKNRQYLFSQFTSLLQKISHIYKSKEYSMMNPSCTHTQLQLLPTHGQSYCNYTPHSLTTFEANPRYHVTSPVNIFVTPQYLNISFSFQIWDSYFYLAVIFINQLCLQLEMFTPSKKKKVLEK